MKMHEVSIREWDEESSLYKESAYPFESDQEFDWFNTASLDIEDVRAFLDHLGYDTEGLRFAPSGIEGVGVVGDNLDLVIGY